MANAPGNAGEERDAPGAAPRGVPSGSAAGARVRQFVSRLSPEDRLLVVLKRELYEGSWDDMVADLRARLEGRPFIFKLVNRITEDLERIERLKTYEREQGVDLSDYVRME